ncbi:MAG TPA: hypothetical protein VN227_08470 [Methanoregula sp.]|nr:hypothetical protein [Methanoregula sp.]
MISALLQLGIFFYGFFQLIIAFTAIVLCMKWKKYEFLAGLTFLLIYAIVDLIETFIFMTAYGMFFDAAQFGFILLALVFFIIGMHPTYAPKMVSGIKEKNIVPKDTPDESIISVLKKF